MSEPIKVLVCGGRDYANRGHVYAALDERHADTGVALVIEGGQRGADRLGREWAKERGVPFRTFDAKWKLYGLAAGPIRNSLMLAEGKPDLALAFPGGTGTADMVKKAKRAGVEVIEPAPTTKGATEAAPPVSLTTHSR